MSYTIIDASQWPSESTEPAGKKRKVWLLDPAHDFWLFRFPKEPGEAWAEKIAEQIAERLGIPHARYELATFGGTVGAMTQDFTGRDALHGTTERPLYPGSALLQFGDPRYDVKAVRSPQHEIGRILAALDGPRGVRVNPPIGVAGVATATSCFIGYLMLDSLIANTDRHHENWGIQVDRANLRETRVALAPSFDHASSLGRNLSDSTRARVLEEEGGMDRFCRRGKSRIFDANGTHLRVRSVFDAACRARPGIGPAWQAHLASVSLDDLLAAVDPVPGRLMGTSAKQFCRSMVECNRRFILSLQLP